MYGLINLFFFPRIIVAFDSCDFFLSLSGSTCFDRQHNRSIDRVCVELRLLTRDTETCRWVRDDSSWDLNILSACWTADSRRTAGQCGLNLGWTWLRSHSTDFSRVRHDVRRGSGGPENKSFKKNKKNEMIKIIEE